MLDNISGRTKILSLKFTDQKAKLFTRFCQFFTSLINAKFRVGNIWMKHVDQNK